jgi:chemotaxis family two-component system sensor kinase Cph1
MMRDLSAALRNQPPVEHAYDRQPLHMPGAVQSYGVLLVADRQSRLVQFASENAGAVLGVEAAEILDRSYLALCDSERERRSVKDAIAPDTILFPNPLRLTVKGRAYDAVFHAQGGSHLIEIEPVDPASANYGDLAGKAVEDLHDPSTVEELYQRAVQVVRDVTGFDRVMLYRFDARYNGQVLAESTREGIGSFLGLFFPSSDIGARVREMYLKNFTRYIPDIGAAAHELVASSGMGQGASRRIDLSHANLRRVQDCHIDYLKNMGVKASMSFSINVDNKLWGLFACHHYAPRLVSYEQRVVCEQTAMMFIFKLNSMSSIAARLAQRGQIVQRIGRDLAVGATLARRIAALDGAWSDQDEQNAARPIVARALAAIHAETNWLLAPDGASEAGAEGGALTPGQRALLDLVEADSAAIVRHGQVYRIGDAPPAMAVYAVASMFGRELPDLRQGDLPVFATDHLTGMAPVACAIKDKAAGVLAVSLSDTDPAYILWFRREQIVHANWAGNPVDEQRGGGALGSNPRASFAAWKEDIRDLSRSWVLEDVEIAYQLVTLLRATNGGKLRALPDMAASLPTPPVAAPWASSRPDPAPRLHPATASPHAPQGTRRIIRVGHL